MLKRRAAAASANTQDVRCQKCLKYGHWSYQCTGKRKYLHRDSRSQLLRRKMTNDKQASNTNLDDENCISVEPNNIKKLKENQRSKDIKKKEDESSDSSESSSSSSSESSDNSDSDSDSDSSSSSSTTTSSSSTDSTDSSSS
uniref:Putative zinc finger cchc domain-containing protein 10 n=1 Tax=Xenopsylla cheopis TaxID=163159 RepID=A0A6M2DMC8_XENCH